MKINKRKLLKITIPIVCVLLVLLIAYGVIFHALTKGSYVIYARHIPKNREPLEIAYLFDKPDEIVYYIDTFRSEMLTDEQRDAVWEAFQHMILTSGFQEYSSLPTVNSQRKHAFLNKCLENYALEFRYEQRRKSTTQKAFAGDYQGHASWLARPLKCTYDGIVMVMSKEDMSFEGLLFYKDLKRHSAFSYCGNLSDRTKMEFGEAARKILPD